MFILFDKNMLRISMTYFHVFMLCKWSRAVLTNPFYPHMFSLFLSQICGRWPCTGLV